MRFDTRSCLAGLAVLLVAVGSAGALTEVRESSDLEFPLTFETVRHSQATVALESLGPARSLATLGEGWRIQKNHWSGNVRMAYGGDYFLSEQGVATERQAEGLARDFLVENGSLLGVRIDNLELRTVRRARGLWAVHYGQVVGGLPVWKMNAFVLMGEDGRLTAFGSDFFPEDGLVEHPVLSSGDAVAAAAQALATTPRTDAPLETEVYLVPAPSGELMELQPAWRVVFEAEQPFGKWETFVHGITGEILARRNFYHPVNVVGSVGGSIQNQPPTLGYCDGEGQEVVAHARVTVSGGGSAITDENGDFDVAHGGSADVTVTTEFNGPYINVNRFTGLGADATLSQTFTPGVPGAFQWDDLNSRQDERDTFFHGNLIRDFMFGLDNTFTYLDGPVTSTVGRTDGFCPGNAWWNIGGQSMNYCEASSQYGNTGEIANVVYHEYGHGITDELYAENGQAQPPGGLHEGNSDVVANFLDRNPIIGYGFYLNDCSGGIRNAENSLTYPAYNENGGHTAGQVIAGFHWEAWQNLLATLPQAEADDIAFNTWHYARALGFPQTFPDQVMWTFIADDDNGNLDDGTPHYDQFCPAAQLKGFVCPEILVGVIINHSRLNHVEGAGGPGYQIVASIVSTEGALDPAELKVLYAVDGGAFAEALLTPTGTPDEFSAVIPALANSGTISYYLYAEDVLGNSRTDPALAPASTYDFDVAQIYVDAEGDISGWSLGVPGDNATTGVWERVDPIGTEAQPGDDATADPYGTQCFVTGQCGGPNCGGGCTLGCNDIDNGTTTLLSPVWDLAGYTNVRVRLEEWYTNNTGADPNNDTWVIDASNDGGTSWTNVLSTQVSHASWQTFEIDVDALFGAADQLRLRFVASDLASGSIVEAAVDDIRILADSGGAVDAPSIGGGAAATVAFALEPNQPNPFRADTRIEFALPSAANTSLAVYNVQGQMVRELVDGPRDAGRHTVDWDGRDSGGQKVAAGVYFYRLQSDGRTVTRKMTVMK